MLEQIHSLAQRCLDFGVRLAYMHLCNFGVIHKKVGQIINAVSHQVNE
jgi:hypothetical protein